EHGMKLHQKTLALAIGLTVASAAGATTPDRNSALNPAEFDKSATACDNLFTHVNKNWIAAHPIPGDRTSWGSFEMLAEQSLDAQHSIAENLAKAQNKAGSIEQKIGDYYAAGMDAAAIEKAGYAPIKDDLKRIDGLKNPEEIADFVRDYAAQGAPFL